MCLCVCMACADGEGKGRDAGGWVPRPVRGGHSGPVVDMCWAADGACLLSVSADQTARIFTTCQGSWCEIARPEVRRCRCVPMLWHERACCKTVGVCGQCPYEGDDRARRPDLMAVSASPGEPL